MKPGPADYGKKRMFDNKQAIDYSKRLQYLNISSVESDGYGGTLIIEDAKNMKFLDREAHTEHRNHE